MKKKQHDGWFLEHLRKCMIIMQLSLFIIVISSGMALSASSYSQNIKLSLEINDATVKEVIKAIEEQSEFIFFYQENHLDLTRQVSIHATDKDIKEILNQLFADTDNIYILNDRQIVLGEAPVIKLERRFASVEGNEVLALQQPRKNEVAGKVSDTDGDPLPGVTITILGTSRGVITDDDGTYEIEAEPSDRLVFSFVGMESQIIDVGAQKTINVEMEQNIDELEEVTIVAFGKQKKESVISSIETIKTDELRVPSSNLTTAFAGRMAGMISYQTSGAPGEDNAQFFIRGITSFGTGKVNPLILIDNVEMTADDLSRMHPDNIASFSILKDATGTALYGARAANGVILITTKEGKEGKMKVSVRVENSFSSPTNELEMADPITYMKMANEAAKTRNPLAALPYRNEKIDNTIRETNPYVYPSTNWMDVLFKDVAINQKANMNISGGGKVAQYYIAGSVSQDNGILKVDNNSDFNNNIDLKKYLVRSNITLNLTNSTVAKVRTHGTFSDYNGPIPGGSELYRNTLNVSPVRFPPYFEPDENFKYEQHTLFGNDGGDFLNPYAQMVSGYRQESNTVMLAQLELEQDFSQWIDGLTVRILGNTMRTSSYDLTRSYNPYYYEVMTYDRLSDEYSLTELNTEEGTEYLSFNPGYKRINSSFYGEASAAYNQTFNLHEISGMLVIIARNELDANAGSLAASLPKRNLGLSGRFTYAYDNKYLTEFNFGYNGSEKFDKGHRWGFFPSIGLGWQVSNEPFWGQIDKVISKMKLKATYGIVGNDDIGAERFFYLSRVDIGGGNSFSTGYDFNGRNRNGVSIGNYANPKIGWETSYKTNLGIELGFFEGKIDIQADVFNEHRTNILQSRVDIPIEMGLWATPQVNVGEAKGRGVDASLDYNEMFNDFWLVGRATFTYATSSFEYYEEPDYSEMPWRSRIGNALSQRWGYVAERLFIDENEVLNSPRQDFGEYGAGDIKYKDINNDEVINELDRVPIGYPTIPEINYGFGLSAGYKNWDVSFFFQGSGRSSFWINADAMSPFIRRGQSETGLAQFIADDYWSETSQNPYSDWPRLSTFPINNNTQLNTMFTQDGSFLRLKSAEFGYSLPESLINHINLRGARFYLSGTNLLLFSKFKLWDVEMGGNGLGYPLQRVFNLGVNVSF